MRTAEKKFCENCGVLISDIYRDDWYSHISIKYCDECREVVKKQQNAARLIKFRERKKQAEKLKNERLKSLELENEILRSKITALWESKNGTN